MKYRKKSPNISCKLEYSIKNLKECCSKMDFVLDENPPGEVEEVLPVRVLLTGDTNTVGVGSPVTLQKFLTKLSYELRV